MSATIVLKPVSTTTTPAMSATNVSPKVSKATKPLPVPLPTYYGCEHIGNMLQKGDGQHTAKDFYGGAARVALDPERLTAQKCVRCSYVLTRTFLCMQCPNVFCPKDAEAHAREKKHSFGVDSRSGHLFCFLCNDYVYDPTMEEIRIEREVIVTGGPRKRRRLEDTKPSPEDLRYIESNSTLPPCRATGLRGLQNMGMTCFMSVVLQGLIHNPLIRNYFLADGHKPKDCTVEHCMSCAVEEVFVEFFTSDRVDGFVASNLLTSSWKCEQNLAGYQQQDAHEYLHFLLNQIHLNNTGITDPKDVSCQCIVHRCFYGKLQSDVTCSGCKNTTTTNDPVMDLSLDLRLKDKKNANGNVGVQTLQECLDRFTSTEKLGLDGYSCSSCTAPHGATKQLTMHRLPPVLCIQLKRFESSGPNGSQKIETRISFPLQLDMTPYTTRAKRKGLDPWTRGTRIYMYELINVVVHKGDVNSGHYISYARENGQWFQFDDSIVTIATEKQVLAAQAYILTYIIRSFG